MNVVYFIEMGGSIKIGTARNLEKRMVALRTSCAMPLFVIGTVAGSFPLERAIHEELKEFRLRGEWFEDCSPVREAIGRYLGGDLPKPRKPKLHLSTRMRLDGPPSRDLQELILLQRRLEFADARGAAIKAEIAYCEAILASAQNPTLVGK